MIITENGPRPTAETAGGLRQCRRARSTGAIISVYDGEEAGMDTCGGRWQTVCETHGGQICSHLTLRTALGFASCPEEWCEFCQKIASPES